MQFQAQENERHKLYIVAPNNHETAHSPYKQFLCVEMRTDKSLRGIYKQVSLISSGGGGWHVTFGT